MTIKFLENEELQRMVDYSFGDHSGVLGGVPNAYMKKANIENKEFVELTRKFVGKTMTLFIDNVRLYKRPLEYSDWMHLKPISAQDRQWIDQFADEDLLDLCSWFPDVKFVIFTAFEDTPLDNHVFSRIHYNVTINAANAVVFGEKVRPWPHGIERIMYPGYDHHEILEQMMGNPINPRKLLFVAHRSDTGDRASIGSIFADKDWATITHLPYRSYLATMSMHKFVLCPSGNGIESARNWETLYMGRVPVFKDHPYLREMFKDFPCLFVNDFDEVTEELLKNNDHLFQKMQTLDMQKLDLDYWFNKAKV